MEEISKFNRANVTNQEIPLLADTWARKSNLLQGIIVEIAPIQDSLAILTTIVEEIIKENKSIVEVVENDQEIPEKGQDQETEAVNIDNEDTREATPKTEKEAEETKIEIDDLYNMIQTQKYTINLKIYSNISSFKLLIHLAALLQL